jgi:hypothetical protein
MDVVMYVVLGIVVLLGVWATVGVNVLGPGHDYRETVAVWFRGIFLLRPDPSLMVSTPPLFQLHTLAALGPDIHDDSDAVAGVGRPDAKHRGTGRWSPAYAS